MKDVPVYHPDSGDYAGDVRVCAFCGQVACLNGEPCAPRRARAQKAAWPPPEERR